MPEKMIEKLKKSALPEWKICFAFAFVVGLVTHLYKITNWLPNWDSLVFRYDAQNMINMGRWFLPVVCAPSSFYDLPLVSGLMAIFFHALGAVCICKMLDVRKSITAALVGSLVASFPTVTSVMMYNYVADGYALAFLLSCVAAMLLVKDKPCYIASVVLIALSSGIYQAYITVTIMLLLFHLILEVIKKESDLGKTIMKALKFLLTGILGMVLYYFVMMVALKIMGAELLEYQGLDNAASLNGIDLAGSLYTAKESFVNYFFNFGSGFGVFCVVNCVIFALTVVLYLTDVIRKKLAFAKIAVVAVLVVMLPLGASALSFINSAIDYHNLMKMGFLVFYLFFILYYEKIDFGNGKLNVAVSWIILCVTAVLVFNNFVIANVSYHKLNMAYEKSYGILVRIADRIEQTENSEDCEKILVAGYLPESEAYSVILPPDITGTTDGYILRADDEMFGQSVLCSALNDYCGKNYKFVHGKEKEDLLKKSNIENFDSWPGKNSVCVIDDVIVIKLGNQV